MNRFILASLLVPSFFVAACGDTDSNPNDVEVDRDHALASASREIALLMHDGSFRAELHAVLAERRTGDYEILVADIADQVLSDGRTLRDVLEPTGALLAVENLHIAMPGGIVGWDVSTAVPVTFIPDATDFDTLRFFDSAGKESAWIADERPSFPVLVLGPNERIRPTVEATAESMTTNANRVYLREIVIENDHEPWTSGDPEIFVICNYERHYYDGINEENVKYVANTDLGFQEGVTCDLYEDDWDSVSYGPGVPGSGDDLIGYATFSASVLGISTENRCKGYYGGESKMYFSKVAAIDYVPSLPGGWSNCSTIY